jgi:vancomycin resistance protein YoaR
MKCTVCALTVPKADEDAHTEYHSGIVVIMTTLQRDMQALSEQVAAIPEPAVLEVTEAVPPPVGGMNVDEQALRARIADEIAQELAAVNPNGRPARMHPRQQDAIDRALRVAKGQ